MTTYRSDHDDVAIQTLNGWIDYAHESGQRTEWYELWKAREVIEGLLQYNRDKVETAIAFVTEKCKPEAKGRAEVLAALAARLEGE